MNLDPVSVSAMSALVTGVCGVVFIVDTLIRRDDGAGRIWALAFLAAMLTTLSYLVWSAEPRASWWASAVGNAAFVAGSGCIWLGCRRYNGRRVRWSSAAVVAAVAAAGVAVLIDGPDGGPWAGAIVMFLSLLVFSGLGAVECLRGEMGRIRTSWGLAFVLGAQSVFYAIRTAVFFAVGPEGELFADWFGTVPTSFLTNTLMIVALVVTSMLRAGRASLHGALIPSELLLAADDVLPRAVFGRLMGDVVTRAQRRGECIGVIAVRIDDLPQFATAFGGESAASIAQAWRASVRRHAPSSSFVGEDDPSGLVVGVQPVSEADARRQAIEIYRGVFDDLRRVSNAVLPAVGVGVSVSDTAGYDLDRLIGVARDAARRASVSAEAAVLVGEADADGQDAVSR